MTPEARLGDCLARHIPLTRAMAIAVVTADTRRVVLSAPLPPNSNHKGTAFGGSIAAVGTLACWGLVYLRLAAGGRSAQIVVQRSKIDYVEPATDDFTARAEFDDAAGWERAMRTLERRRRARLTLTSQIEARQATVARFEGVFAIAADDD